MPPIAALTTSRRSNFMNMSDEDDSDVDSPRPPSDDGDYNLLFAFFEPEDLVLPAEPISSSPPSPLKRKSISPSKRFSRRVSRRPTKDWLPMQSFMDLKSEDESSVTHWSWRSKFIDVAPFS